MTEKCWFCLGPVNPHDRSTWKRVSGWVGGPRKDAMTMRQDTGHYAHNHCVHKAKNGNAPDQADLFGEEPVPEVASDDAAVDEVFDSMMET